MRTRSPRRKFDREKGVASAQALFHEHGYDGVGVADLTKALDINPPSLYAAYGSKAGIYERALERYVAQQALPLSAIFDDESSLGDAIHRLLMTAARQYTRDEKCRGCLVTEGMRAADPAARAIACQQGQRMIDAIHTEIAVRAEEQADLLTDLVVTTIRGLSAAAFSGMETERLLAVAETAAKLFRPALDVDERIEKERAPGQPAQSRQER